MSVVEESCRSLAPEHGIIDTKLKWAVVGLAVILVVVLGVQMVHRAAFSTELNSGFTTYRAAGWAVLNDSDIYQVRNARGWAYVYPPPFAKHRKTIWKANAFRTGIYYPLSLQLSVLNRSGECHSICPRGWYEAATF